MFRHIVIRPRQVLADTHDLLALPASEGFLAVLGKPSRSRDIKLHSRGKRVAMVWDAEGLVAYADYPEKQMSHFYLAFAPKETPESPAAPSKAVIEINGAIVSALTTVETLPGTGPTPIVTDPGRHYFYQVVAFSVYFSFARIPNEAGRLPSVGKLEHVSFSWKRPIS